MYIHAYIFHLGESDRQSYHETHSAMGILVYFHTETRHKLIDKHFHVLKGDKRKNCSIKEVETSS